MDYIQIHDSIIDRARCRKYDSKIYQNHHIIPICEDEFSTELVPLTIKEHRIVHLLRYKMNKGLGNLIAYNMMVGKFKKYSHDDSIKISSLAGQLGGRTTKDNNLGIFSDSWDRSAETTRRHELGIIVPYLKGNPELASIAGLACVQSKTGIFSPDYDRSQASKSLWESGLMDHVRDLNRSHAKQGGDAAYAMKVGIHGLTKEEHLQNSSKGGKVSGKLPRWTNGVSNRHCIECPGEGWYRGRTFLKPRTPTKKKWWNNGTINVMSEHCPEEGWVRGCLKSKRESK